MEGKRGKTTQVENRGIPQAENMEIPQAEDARVLQAEKEEEPAEMKRVDSWLVKVMGNPEYCGIGAGGIQFANGQAVIHSGRMAAWFREHKGYSVLEQ